MALAAGTALDPARKHAIAEKLHNYTGLPVEYIERANLRVNGGEFEHTLQIDRGLTTGRLDSRFSGPTMDALNQGAAYDPQSAAISSAYVAAFNDYVRKQLKFGQDQTYQLFAEGTFPGWKFEHKQPGAPFRDSGFPERDPGSRRGDEVQPAHARDAELRLLRSGHAVLHRGLRNAPSVDSGRA